MIFFSVFIWNLQFFLDRILQHADSIKTYGILCLTLFSCLYLPQTKVIKEKKMVPVTNKQIKKEKIKLMQIGNKIDENGRP